MAPNDLASHPLRCTPLLDATEAVAAACDDACAQMQAHAVLAMRSTAALAARLQESAAAAAFAARAETVLPWDRQAPQA